MMFRLILAVVFALGMSPAFAEQGEKPFIISYFDHPQIPPIREVIKQSYADIGIKVEFIELPIGRGLINLNKGITDADVVRPVENVNNHPNVRFVPPAITQSEIVLFCTLEVSCNLSVIENKDVTITTFKTINVNIQKLFSKTLKASLHNVTDFVDMINLLKRERIHYIAIPIVKGNVPVELQTGFNNVTLHEYETGHMIHYKHEHLIPKLSAALAKNLMPYHQANSGNNARLKR